MGTVADQQPLAGDRWEAAADWRWHSAEIGAAFGLEVALATVYTPAGRRMLHEGEVEDAIAQRDWALEHERQLRARDQAALAEREQELERLRRLLEERQGR